MRAARWVAVVLAALMLAGCSELPVSGPVQVGSTEGPNDTTIVYQPSPPAPGASQEEIVTGFLAAASAGGDFRVAKEYLAPAFAEKWRPRTRVLLQAAQPKITATSKTDFTATVPITAKVDEDGVYEPSTQPVPLPFHLVQRGGQWRIDSTKDGIVLGQPVFQRIYGPQALEFFDPSWTRLVPDLRWFPTSSNDTPLRTLTAVVAALIKGPAGPIASGVTVNALRGASVAGIDPGNGVTTVVLTVEGESPSADTLERMQQQLIRSLRRPTPAALRLQVNGVVAPQVKALINQPGSLLPYVVSDGKFGTMAGNGAVTEDKTLGKRITDLKPEAVTVSVRQGLAGVLTRSSGVAIVTAGGQRVVDPRSSLLPPAVDQRGWVYSVPKDSPTGLRASNAKRTVDLAGDLGGTSVIAIEVSPDGTRMLVFVQSATGPDAGPEAYVAGIERSVDGTPTGLTRARYAVDLGGNTGLGLGATWVDDGDVAVLVSAPDNSSDRVLSQQLGGFGSSLSQLTNATSIVGTSDQADLRVHLSTGDLFVWRSTVNAWQSEPGSAVDVSVLAVQR